MHFNAQWCKLVTTFKRSTWACICSDQMPWRTKAKKNSQMKYKFFLNIYNNRYRLSMSIALRIDCPCGFYYQATIVVGSTSNLSPCLCGKFNSSNMAHSKMVRWFYFSRCCWCECSRTIKAICMLMIFLLLENFLSDFERIILRKVTRGQPANHARYAWLIYYILDLILRVCHTSLPPPP